MDPATLACLRLINELECERYSNHPFCGPFIRYLMQWPHYLPIKTIIIGQNPYPGNIFPELGAALAYDSSKTNGSTPSVRVLSEDLFNFDGTDRQDTINCFRDSWHLLEFGVIMINETVFHKISNSIDRPNTRGIRELEAQVRALQIILFEGYKLGQESITLIGMGIGAAIMTSIIRPWCPNDLISVKVMTCSNPAALSSMLGDSSSHEITLGKSHITKILSKIVSQYREMPPKYSAIDKKRQQNIDVLNKSIEELKSSGQARNNELRSFKDRLTQADPTKPFKATMEDLCDAITATMKATDRHSSAMDAHSATMLMIMNSIYRDNQKQDEKPSVTLSSSNIKTTPDSMPRGPRRRVPPRQPAVETKVEPIEEDTTSEIVTTKSLAVPPSRSRRRVVKTASVAGTDYTATSTVEEATNNTQKDIRVDERTHITNFANWLKMNHSNDLSFSVILASAADRLMADNELTKSVLEYIKTRKSQDASFDSYDELNDPDSASTSFIRDFMEKYST
nr:hypothetical protein CFP56_77012 [Quercus suber]